MEQGPPEEEGENTAVEKVRSRPENVHVFPCIPETLSWVNRILCMKNVYSENAGNSTRCSCYPCRSCCKERRESSRSSGSAAASGSACTLGRGSGGSSRLLVIVSEGLKIDQGGSAEVLV